MALRKIPNNTDVFIYENLNPKDKRTCDCTLRALSLFLDKSWEEVYTDLFAVGMKYKLMLNDPACYKKYLKQLGFEINRQPKHHDNTKYTGREFCLEKADFSKKYLVHIGGNHISCIVNNKLHDIWDCSDGCIGNYWCI